MQTTTKTAAAKAFKKGEIVTYVGIYSRETGAFYFRTCVVMSCGAKRMTLADATTGKMLGSDFCPLEGFASLYHRQLENDTRPACVFYGHGTFKHMADADAERFCLECSALWIEAERQHIAACIARDGASAGYVAAMQAKQAAFAECAPSAIKH